MSTYLIQFFVYTMGITGILVVGFIFSKKFLINNMNPLLNVIQGKGPKRKIHLEECFRLDQNKALYVVAVDGERYFLGATNQEINLLAELASYDTGYQKPEIPPTIQNPYRTPGTASGMNLRYTAKNTRPLS